MLLSFEGMQNFEKGLRPFHVQAFYWELGGVFFVEVVMVGRKPLAYH